VELAYLERKKPTLDEAVASLVKKRRRGFASFRCSSAPAATSRRICRSSAEAARARHAGVEIVLETTIGERQEITDAIAAVISKGISHQSR
jgi:hypothetical protein